MTDDFKDTVFLPQTEFPMRGELPKREPETLKKWQEIDLFKVMTESAKDRPLFLLHDGPPFANGELHAGHALQKILKDLTLRTRFALGFNAPMTPGWDCHGLPIEWKVEEKYRKQNKNKDDVPVADFLKECREFAEHWIGVQSKCFQRMGVVADWKNPYKTMDFSSEATIVSEIHKFLMKDMLTRGVRPVLWSVVEKTALAAAEVEYHEHASTTLYIAFPIKTGKPELKDASIIIWTTTPWTLPGNRAIAYGEKMEYALYEITEVADDSKATVGKKILLNTSLADAVMTHAKITGSKKLNTYKGSELGGTICSHPLYNLDAYYTFDVPVLPGDFVTADAGTGFVHIAPGHGEDDYNLGRANKITIPETVDGDGTYYKDVGLFAGLDVYDANGKEGKATGAVIGKMIEAGAMLAKGKLRHSYPHSWRSKAPLIFRTTAQWFIPLDQKMTDGTTLREKALKAIDETQWIPAEGKNRIGAMVSDRQDWCVSRQRLWGVPLAMFVNKATRQPLQDDAVNARIVEAFKQEGLGAWHTHDPQDFLGDTYKAADFEQIKDIIDVWFESGTTHAFVLKKPDSAYPAADLYLEGSDQHRGWFQSSLLECCGTRGKAPYKAVLTHGYTVDKDGKKMSKSLGNGIMADELMDQYGADIVRMWVLSSDYREDIRTSHEAMKIQSENYRRFRNTLRYILGNLDGFTNAERIDLTKDYAKLPELEKWILHRISEVNTTVKEAVTKYEFNAAFRAVFDFCNADLSAFYFDIRKDRLYCDRADLFERRATRSVLEALFSALTMWLAPFIPFTAEETWAAKGGDVCSNVHVQTVHQRIYEKYPTEWNNAELATKWARIRDIRRVVTGAIEIERAEKRIGSSLEAHPTLYLAKPEDQKICAGIDWAELAITSQFTLQNGASSNSAQGFTVADVSDVAVTVTKAIGEKCQRSWKILTDVGSDPDYPTLSKRDADAVRHYRKIGKAA